MKRTLLKSWNGYAAGEEVEVGNAFIGILAANGYIDDPCEKKVPEGKVETKKAVRDV